jgi:YfiR/HmsC-like
MRNNVATSLKIIVAIGVTSTVSFSSMLGAESYFHASEMESSGGKEYQIKAAILFNVLKFTDWPAANTPSEQLVVGIVGEDPFGSTIEKAFSGKKKGKSSIVIKRYQSLSGLTDSDLGEIHAVFVTDGETKSIGEMRSKLEGAGILIVGESDGSAKNGHVATPMKKGKIKIQVNKGLLEAAGFKMKSKLLQSAEIVK